MKHVRLLTGLCLALVAGWAGVAAAGRQAPSRASSPAAAHGPCPVCALAHAVGVRMVPLVEPRLARCPPPAPIARSPRGNVAVEALDDVRIDLEIPPESLHGILRFWDETGRVVYEHWEPWKVVAWSRDGRDLPGWLDAMRGAAGQVTWGWVRPRARRLADVVRPCACFRPQRLPVVHVRERAALEARLAGAAPRIARLVRAQWLLDRGLHEAARAQIAAARAEAAWEPHGVALKHRWLQLVGTDLNLRGDPSLEAPLARALRALAAGAFACDLARSPRDWGARPAWGTGARSGCR